MNLSKCGAVPRVPVRNTWYRAVNPKYLGTALSTGHTTTTPSRFSSSSLATPGFEILYLAENPMVALFEARALFGSPSMPGGVVPHPSRPLVTFPITVALSSVADITDAASAAGLDTNAQELTGDWRTFSTRSAPVSAPAPHTGLPPTQALGIALYSLPGLQGLISFSATLPDYRILAIFTDRLKGTTDFIEYSYHDEHGAQQVKRIP